MSTSLVVSHAGHAFYKTNFTKSLRCIKVSVVIYKNIPNILLVYEA